MLYDELDKLVGQVFERHGVGSLMWKFGSKKRGLDMPQPSCNAVIREKYVMDSESKDKQDGLR